ncbi:MAG: DUF1353 domain-containing protein [candidate division Zixibacteria bacterium]
MRILNDFFYTDPNGKNWSAPTDCIVDGASIPRPLWTLVGSPYTDDYRRASVVHDVACDNPNVKRKDADVMFYHACRAGGCSARKAKLLYLGVRIGVWSRETLPEAALSKERLYVDIPIQADSDAKKIQNMFLEIADELRTIDDEATLEQLDKVISKHLQF